MASAFLPALSLFALPVDGPLAAASKSRGLSPASAAASTRAAGSAASSPESLYCESLDTPALGLELKLPFALDPGHPSTAGVIEVLEVGFPPEDGAAAKFAPPPGLKAPARSYRAEQPGLGALLPDWEAHLGAPFAQSPLATVPLASAALSPPLPRAALTPTMVHTTVSHAAPHQIWSTQPQTELPWGPPSAAPAGTWQPRQASLGPAGALAFPSVGSAGHPFGTCKPCAFFHTKGCGNGSGCAFCHICGPTEIARRKKERKADQVAQGWRRAALQRR